MPIQILQLESTTSDGVELKSYVCLPESASNENPRSEEHTSLFRSSYHLP